MESAKGTGLVNIEHADTYPAGIVVNFSHSGGIVVLAQIHGLSERDADYRMIMYESSGGVVTHDCATVACMPRIHVQTTPKPPPKVPRSLVPNL